MSWTIRQMSKQSGIPVDSLRYYDKLGIVSPKREINGYRLYDEKDFGFLQYIVVMKYAQFSLAEIKEIINLLGHEPNDQCNQSSKEILYNKINFLTQTIENYKQISKLLESILPLMNNSKTYHMSQIEIDTFVKKIYDNIIEVKEGNEL